MRYSCKAADVKARRSRGGEVKGCYVPERKVEVRVQNIPKVKTPPHPTPPGHNGFGELSRDGEMGIAPATLCG